MFLLSRRNVLAASGGLALSAGLSALLPRLAGAALDEPQVLTGDAGGAMVDSTVIFGENGALVIDAQFTKSNAARLVDLIQSSGRQLETVFISHFHPDHHFGIGTLKQAYPDAKVLAHPSVAGMLAKMGQGMFDQRKGVMGDAIPDRWLAPEPLDGALMLEGERFDVLDPMHGDTAEITPVDLPQFDALVAADLVYNGTWAWLKETPDAQTAQAWIDSLDQIEAMGRSTIIPGHKTEDATNDASGFDHNRRLLQAWQSALDTTKGADELKAAMVAEMGELPGEFFLDTAISAFRG